MIEDNEELELNKEVQISANNKLMFKMSNISAEEISLDNLLRVNISNIGAELLTITIVLNHFGILLADVTSNYGEAKLALSVHESNLRESILSEPRTKKPTKEDIDAEITRDKIWQVRKKAVIRKQKEMEYVSAIYWSLKSKDDKISSICRNTNIKTGDIEEELINSRLRKINLVDIKLIKQL